MRSYPTPDDDMKEVDSLKAEPWQLDLLKLNPRYVYWGSFEDYMSKEGQGWDSRVIKQSWSEMSDWGLDELNECVNFYFEVYRKSHSCPHCEGSGLNKASKKISDDWYSHLRTDGQKGWSGSLTDVEVLALAKHGRLEMIGRCFFDEAKNSWWQWKDGEKVEVPEPEMPSAEAVNAHFRHGLGHDSINHWICSEVRARHLGVYGSCEHCEDGSIYDEPKARIALQLWMIHPRKGCSRGVYIEEIKQEDLPEVMAFLKEAATRNQKRFEKLFE